ncbi:hypothetical protein D910_09719 [Dendroctonus ponderosae]|uniref:Uncharacterized protein n=1 Tax=Dendroctonus ponderosae TaxID=77166 RepID=U4UQS8_DENPD|nr:hypothetical protein D910_09719 [Dendroctonus ponderosae]
MFPSWHICVIVPFCCSASQSDDRQHKWPRPWTERTTLSRCLPINRTYHSGK